MFGNTLVSGRELNTIILMTDFGSDDFHLVFFNAISQNAIDYHLHHFHCGVYAQVIQEGRQVLLHLDAVVVHLGHSEDAHLALPPNLQNVIHRRQQRPPCDMT